MITAKKASFNFTGFKVLDSHFKFNDNIRSEFGINFDAKGKHYAKTNIFKLFLKVQVLQEPEKLIFIELDTESTFVIQAELSELEELMKFFVKNAPAIVFPYIRAYVSTLTTQSGNRPIILPTLNLIGLSEGLSKNIERIEE